MFTKIGLSMVAFVFILTGAFCSPVWAGSSINIGNGNLRHTQTLFQIPYGKLLESFTLTYNSLDGSDTPLGTGWTHVLNIRLSLNNDGTYTIYEGDGRKIVLYKNGGRYTPEKSNYPILTLNANGTSILERKEGIFYSFNQTRRLTSLFDRNSNAIALTYNSKNNLTGITDPSGRKISLDYDQNNRIITIADTNGNVHGFVYTGANLSGISSKITQVGMRNWSFTYYDKGFLWTKTDPLGNKIEYFYDDQYRVVGVIDPEGREREVVYDAAKSQTQFIEKDTGIWLYDFDSSLGVLKKKTDPLKNFWSYSYYPDGKLQSALDPNGHSISYAYDENGNVTLVKDALDHETKFTYNSFNKVATIELDPKEPLITFSYDARGNLTGVVDQMGTPVGYEYDAKGNLTAIKHPLEQIGFEYSPQNYLVLVKNLITELALYEFGYDEAGNRTWTKEVQKTEEGEPEKIIRYEYNGLNRVTKFTGPPPEFHETSYQYDLNGNIQTIIDGNGIPTLYDYNYRGQATKTIDVLGYMTEFKYGTGCPTCNSGVDKLTSVTDAKKQTTTFKYYQNGNLWKEISPMGFVTSYTYDPAGNRESRTDANGNTTFYEFDELNRLKKVLYPDQTTVDFTYDYRGNVKTATNPNISYSLEYNFNNRLTKVLDSEGNLINYEYNTLGNRIRMASPDQRVVEYSYDLGNYLSQILVDSIPSFSFTHDSYGRRKTLGYPNGITTKYAYNPSGFLTHLKTQTSKQALINSFTFTYDGVGNRKTMADLKGVHEYEYDEVNQLIQATHPTMPAEQYDYDEVGNRFGTNVDEDNRLREDGTFSYEYDNNGNLTRKVDKKTKKVMHYSYDWENRLIKVESSNRLAQYEYKYDPFGRRIERRINRKVTQYVYDGANLILEQDAKENIVSKYLHNLEIDEPLALERGRQVYYYHADGLGSITDLTNGMGRVVKSYRYKGFGEIHGQTGLLSQPFTFTGREYDAESGLYYYRARYYDPKAGRFITKDPIGFAAGDVNLYRYVGNNPLGFLDPWGLKKGDWWDPATYFQISFSYTNFVQGETLSGGIWQKTITPLTLFGSSIDFYFGALPSPYYSYQEFQVGFNRHTSIGFFLGEPDCKGDFKYGGIVLHFGLGFGLPFLTDTEPTAGLPISIPSEGLYYEKRKDHPSKPLYYRARNH